MRKASSRPVPQIAPWSLCVIARALLVGTAIACLTSRAAQADDWPQWRGPKRDGVWRETGILQSFPAAGLKTRWRAPVGPGWTSPIVVGAHVFLTDMRLEKPKAWERLHCFNATNGELRWTREVELKYPDWAFIPEHGGGPAATPIVDRGRIYWLGRNGPVECLDTANGKSIWKTPLDQQYRIAELSCRGSPLLEGNLLIVSLGGKPGACVVALDRETGRESWKALDEPVSNSSPLIVGDHGKRQLIVWTDASVTSLNPGTGETRWREAMVTSNNDAVATPVVGGNRLLISGLMLELTWKDERPGASILWPDSKVVSKRILSNTSTPWLRDKHVFSARSNGEFVCLDADTGRQLWSTTNVTELKTGASIHLTPVSGDMNGHRDGMFLFTDQGNLIRAELTPEGYREISRARLLAPTSDLGNRKFAWVPPAFANRHVFARNDQELVCVSLQAE
jgi:outer membrane protein assembly factor BamB